MRRLLGILILLLSTMVGISALGLATRAPVALVPMLEQADIPVAEPAGSIEELRARIEAIGAGLEAGVGVGIVEDGEVTLLEGFGMSDPGRGVPSAPDAMYRVGSFSKTFLSMAVVALADRGAFGLEDPIRDLMPGIAFENPWRDTDPVRVTHLLEHTTGFDEMRFNEIEAAADQLDWSPRQVLDLNPRSRRVRWRPGTRHSYSHPGYTVGGHLVEVASGTRFEEYLEETLFTPMGLDSATFRYSPEVERRLARGYEDGGLVPRPHMHLHHRAGSNLYVSLRDMTRFVQIMLGRGAANGEQLIPARWVERMERGSTLKHGAVEPNYGPGLYSSQGYRVISFGHGGWMPGYHSSYRYAPAAAAGYVVLTNEPVRPFLAWEIESEVRAYVARDAPRLPAAPVVRLRPEQLNRFTGTYRRRAGEVEILRALTGDLACKVRRHGDRLVFTGNGCDTLQLVPTSETTFRELDQSRPSVVFTRSPEGAEVMWDANSFGYFERESAAWATAREIVKVVVALVLLGGLVWPVLWLPALVFGRSVSELRLRVLAGIGAWSLALMIHLLFTSSPPDLGTVSWPAVMVFVASWAVTVCGLSGTVLAVTALRRDGSDGEATSRVFALLVSLALGICAARMAMHGLVGLRTWLW